MSELNLKKNLSFLGSCEDLLKIISKSVLGVQFFNNEVTIHIKRNDLLYVSRLLRDHSLLQFKSVVDITCVDYPTKKERFDIIYNFLSYKNNSRLRLKVTSNELTPVPSIVSLFKGAGWLEREVWDLFGVLFIGNPDLRRILTDYGFEGFPLRKDFPLTGFIEVRYDDEKKTVVYESLEVAQEFRLFNFASPWEQINNLSSYEKLK